MSPSLEWTDDPENDTCTHYRVKRFLPFGPYESLYRACGIDIPTTSIYLKVHIHDEGHRQLHLGLFTVPDHHLELAECFASVETRLEDMPSHGHCTAISDTEFDDYVRV